MEGSCELNKGQDQQKLVTVGNGVGREGGAWERWISGLGSWWAAYIYQNGRYREGFV